MRKDSGELWQHVTPDSSRSLLLAALDVFAEVGFVGATTREIAARAGMSPAAVYVHYKVKHDLLQEIVEVGHQAVWDTIAESLEGVERPADRLQVFAESSAAWHACNYKLGRVCDYELGALPPERSEKVIEIRHRIEGLVRAELRRGVRDDGFDVPDLRGTTLAIVSLGVDLVRWYSPQRKVSVEKIAILHGQLVRRMVQPWAVGETDAPAGNGAAPARRQAVASKS